MTIDDPYELERFLQAQERDATFERALDELRRGQKTGHWMWFIFPQVAGLGRSATSRYYAISSLAEARAYLAHPVLGPRLRAGAALLAARATKKAPEILGGLDAQKLRSSMTLFLRAAPGEALFQQVLDVHFAGETDAVTDALLGYGSRASAPE